MAFKIVKWHVWTDHLKHEMRTMCGVYLDGQGREFRCVDKPTALDFARRLNLQEAGYDYTWEIERVN